MQRFPFLVWLEGYDNRNFRPDSLYLCVPLVRSSRAPNIPLPVLAIEVGAVFRWKENEMRKVTSDTVVYYSTFRLFMVIVVLP